jgi:hypothetical protein
VESEISGFFQRSRKKSRKKCLTTFLGGGIELEKFNLVVLFFHKLKKKGGENWGKGGSEKCWWKLVFKHHHQHPSPSLRRRLAFSGQC